MISEYFHNPDLAKTWNYNKDDAEVGSFNWDEVSTGLNQ